MLKLKDEGAYDADTKLTTVGGEMLLIWKSADIADSSFW